MRGRPEPDDVRELVRGCAAGDGAARRAFQDRWGEDVYNFPVKIYGMSAERAADFYVYVFEGDRLFTRMRTFEGRNGIQFRTFLAYYVLRSLFLEWQRGSRELDTVSLGDDEPVAPSTEGAALPAAGADVTAAWAGLSPEERVHGVLQGRVVRPRRESVRDDARQHEDRERPRPRPPPSGPPPAAGTGRR